jgi:hypothetical protein
LHENWVCLFADFPFHPLSGLEAAAKPSGFVRAAHRFRPKLGLLRFATIGSEGILPKERIRERSRESGRRDERSGLDNRTSDASGPVHEKRGDTRIDTLRQTYGKGFAPGVRGDTHLKTLLDRTGSSSLSEYLKTAGQSPVTRSGIEDLPGQKPPAIRYASDERFREAHRKTSALHAGLFRRLAE